MSAPLLQASNGTVHPNLCLVIRPSCSSSSPGRVVSEADWVWRAQPLANHRISCQCPREAKSALPRVLVGPLAVQDATFRCGTLLVVLCSSDQRTKPTVPGPGMLCSEAQLPFEQLRARRSGPLVPQLGKYLDMVRLATKIRVPYVSMNKESKNSTTTCLPLCLFVLPFSPPFIFTSQSLVLPR